MKRNLKTIIFILVTTLSCVLNAQNRNILVEHFTNSWCSICASRNPGFYQNLRAQQDVLHIAYHPSSPYAGCLLNQHNKTENDAKTNYYAIYGSTPRIVLNGVVQSSSANYASAAIFNPFKNLSAGISIRVKQELRGDSVKSKITITKITNQADSNLKLHIMYVEDTLFYSSPNGESQHYDVFRKTANGVDGITINLPNNINDSVIYNSYTLLNSAWNKNRIYTLAFVQNTSKKSVLNAAKSYGNELPQNTGLKTINEIGVKIYPNPTQGDLTIETLPNELNTITIQNIIGTTILTKEITQTERLNLSQLPKGWYLVQIVSNKGKAVHKIIVN